MANAIVVGVNAQDRYDPNEGFSKSFLAHTGVDILAALVSMRTMKSANGMLAKVDKYGNVRLFTFIREGRGLPWNMTLRDYLSPNALRGTLTTVLSGWTHEAVGDC